VWHPYVIMRTVRRHARIQKIKLKSSYLSFYHRGIEFPCIGMHYIGEIRRAKKNRHAHIYYIIRRPPEGKKISADGTVQSIEVPAYIIHLIFMYILYHSPVSITQIWRETKYKWVLVYFSSYVGTSTNVNL